MAAEPTTDHLLGALAHAKDLLKRNHEWDLNKAIAEAAVTTCCDVAGHKVFRDARIAVHRNVINSAPRAAVIGALDATIQQLRGN